jgi:hypothetical protein
LHIYTFQLSKLNPITMKNQNRFVALILIALITLSASGCASILGGPITDAQKRKPAPGEPQRQVRAGFLIVDLLCGLIPVVVDFGTGAIYKPGNTTKPVARGTANEHQP